MPTMITTEVFTLDELVERGDEKAVERAENDDEMLSVVMLAPFSVAGGFFGFIEKMANAVDRKAQNYVKRAERAERAKRARAKLDTN